MLIIKRRAIKGESHCKSRIKAAMIIKTTRLILKPREGV